MRSMRQMAKGSVGKRYRAYGNNVGEDGNKFIGVNRFDDDELRVWGSLELEEKVKRVRMSGEDMSKQDRDAYADSLFKWARAKNCESFSHWFNPIRGSLSGEKHDTLIPLDDSVIQFSQVFNGKRLFFGETDGSSFPHGGMRNTHSAAAYTAWDMQSPPFIYNKTVYIPAAFIAWSGEPLDEKTPLLRSGTRLDRSAKRLLKALGEPDCKSVRSEVGWEQEFFVVPRQYYMERPDLLNTERTLFGALPPKHQQTSAHYYGKIPVVVREFLEEVREELWKIGSTVQSVHNEVAPSQHELSPVFTLSNVASDQNRFAVQLMKEIAFKHDLACIFHEKPFKGVNGSGKHTNYSISINDTNEPLFQPGKTIHQQSRFMAFMAAITRAVSEYPELLRWSIASASNDHRIGMHEAPPSIISISLGDHLTSKVDKIIADANEPLHGFTGDETEELGFGTDAVPPIIRPKQDRNRTSVLPFCGNRFEFRSVGSNQLINLPVTILNSAIAQGLDILSEQIEGGMTVQEAVRDMFTKHRRAIFNGDGYSEEWVVEAKERGLPNLKTTVDALDNLLLEKNIQLLTSQDIFTPESLKARQELMYEAYTNQILIEARTSLEMLSKNIIPTVIRHISEFSVGSDEYIQPNVEKLHALQNSVLELRKSVDGIDTSQPLSQQARYALEVINPQMHECRMHADELETITHNWPYPTYADLMYSHHDV